MKQRSSPATRHMVSSSSGSIWMLFNWGMPCVSLLMCLKITQFLFSFFTSVNLSLFLDFFSSDSASLIYFVLFSCLSQFLFFCFFRFLAFSSSVFLFFTFFYSVYLSSALYYLLFPSFSHFIFLCFVTLSRFLPNRLEFSIELKYQYPENDLHHSIN